MILKFSLKNQMLMVKYKDLVQEDHTSASKNWLILFSKNNPCHKHLQKLIMTCPFIYSVT